MQCHWLLWIHKLPAVEELILHLILPHICEGEVRGSPWNVIPQLLLAVGGRGGRGEQGILPQGPMRVLFSLYRLHHMLFLYLSLSILHCLDSVREHVGRTLSNAFTVSVDKLFDALNTLNQHH